MLLSTFGLYIIEKDLSTESEPPTKPQPAIPVTLPGVVPVEERGESPAEKFFTAFREATMRKIR
jgi:hypothetical protein